MYSVELKVKRMSLEAEAYIIRGEEKKAKDVAKMARWKQKANLAEKKMATWDSLYRHRKLVVRPEARAAHIAHAYLRNMPYQVVEQKILLDRLTIDGMFATMAFPRFWNRVVDIVLKFGPEKDKEKVKEQVYAWRNQHPMLKDIKHIAMGA